MAKRSSAKAIRDKSKAMFPTAGSKAPKLNAILDGRGKPPIGMMPSDEELEAKYIDGGYTGKACPTCFTKYSKSGSCNCD